MAEFSDGPTDTERAELRWVRATTLAPYLEHGGDINGQEYLEALREAGVELSENFPAVLAVWDEGGLPVATLFDGNHRLLLALAGGRDPLVPLVVTRSVFSTMPGVAYHGELG